MLKLLPIVLALIPAMALAVAPAAPKTAAATTTTIPTTSNNFVTLTWTIPTTYTNGTAFTAYAGVNLYRAPTATDPTPTFWKFVPAPAATFTDSNLLPGTYCYSLQAKSTVATDSLGAFSNAACITVLPQPVPNTPSAPATVTITVTTP